MWRLFPPKKTNDAAIYDERAHAWWDFSDPVFEPLHAMLPARQAYLRRHGIEVAGKRVLDVGAGGGYVALMLAAGGAAVVAVDAARQALLAGVEQQRALPPSSGSVAFVQAGAELLPVRPASVDLVVCTDVLVHLPDPRTAIAAMAVALRPGGVFWFSTINSTWVSRFVMITLGEDLLRFVHRGTHDPATFISPARMRGWLEDAGLQWQAAEGMGPVGLTQRLRLRMGRLPTLLAMWQGHATKAG
jgi:2-polyprenyl-6-hydroxyphenyl methylase / 3-demethylubiquinone-9 3-methyltransferase